MEDPGATPIRVEGNPAYGLVQQERGSSETKVAPSFGRRNGLIKKPGGGANKYHFFQGDELYVVKWKNKTNKFNSYTYCFFLFCLLLLYSKNERKGEEKTQVVFIF